MAERDVILKRFAGGSTWDILYPKTKALNVDGLGTAGLVNLNSNNRFVTDAEKTAWNNKFNTPTGTTSQYVRGNGSLATFPSIPTKTSDLTNDGVYEPSFTKNSAFNKNFGTTGGTVTQGNDSRLSNARASNDVLAWAKIGNSDTIPTSKLPALAVTDTFEVATQSAMTSLTAQKGDIAIRTDLNKTFILAAEPASTVGNWKELKTPTDAVLSVAGLTGAITSSNLKIALALNNVENKSSATIRGEITSANVTSALGFTPAESSHSHSVATPSSHGFMSVSDKTRLDSMDYGAQVNAPTNLSRGTRSTTTLNIDSSTGSSVTLPAVTTSFAGLMTSADKTRLDGMATGATANTGTVTNVSAGTTQVSGLTLSVANGTTTPTITTSISNASNFRTAIGAAEASHEHSVATVGSHGFMSVSDKTKLNSIDYGAQVNVGTNLSLGNRTATTLRIDSSTGDNYTLPSVTTSHAGLMSATDKTKLDGIDTGAQKNRVELLRARSGVDNLTIHNNATVTGVGSQLNLGDTIMFEVLNTGAITAATPKILTATVSVTSNSASELRSVTFTTWTGSAMKVFSLSVALTSGALTFGNMNVMQMSKSGTDMNITNSGWTAYIGRIWKVDGSVI